MKHMLYNKITNDKESAMKDINTILKEYRTRAKMSLDKLSQLTGVPKSTLSRYENNHNQKLDIKKIYEIAEVLEIPNNEIEEVLFGGLTMNEQFSVKVPLIGRVCAGNGIIAYEDVIGHEVVEAKYGSGDYFCLQVKGDSMSPKIDNGDIVLCKKQDSVENGDLAIVIVDDEEGMIKQVEYGDDSIKLISFNLFYPERVFEKYNMERVKIIGKVIESKRKW